jgi:3-methyl-2-oxobutanoate hydroxymethyltransferase
VKIEGVRGHLNVIQHLVESGIPVMGHLGLLPQSVNVLGGYKVQARTTAAAARLQREAAELQDAGAFALVLECVPRTLSKIVTRDLEIPAIGIGAGGDCDGQVLVFHDFLGLNPGFQPRFVRRFADGTGALQAGVRRYAKAVRAGRFPGPKESF